MKQKVLLLLLLCLSVGAKASQYGQIHDFRDTSLPKVFVIGQNEALESIINSEYNYALVSVFNENPQAAFEEWANMILRMDQVCTTGDMDIRGIKAFATFYWSKDGKLERIGYALKANSRYIRHDDLTYFFTRFMQIHKLPVPKTNKKKFSHSFTLTLPYPREITTPRPHLSHSNYVFSTHIYSLFF